MKLSRSWFAAVLLAVSLLAATSAAQAQSQELIDAARREGNLVWYTGIALGTAENIAEMFQREYGFRVEVVRSGSERIFSRFLEEAAVGITYADVVETSDAGNFVYMKDQGLLASYVPEGARFIPEAFKDPEGYWHTWRVSPIVAVYNPEIVPASEAPRSWRDFLDPRWHGQVTVGHPEYSGSIVTGVHALVDEFGWDFFRELAQRDVMLGRSVHDAPQSVAAGERALGLMALEYFAYNMRDQGNPLEIIYPEEGLPLVASVIAVSKNAPNPNAARLFVEFVLSEPVQQLLIDQENLHVFHPNVTYPAGRPLLGDLKLLVPDARALLERAQETKQTFAEIFEGR